MLPDRDGDHCSSVRELGSATDSTTWSLLGKVTDRPLSWCFECSLKEKGDRNIGRSQGNELLPR